MPHPIFILAPARCFTSLVCAAVGQHPEMYGTPELNLFVGDTMWQWWIAFGRGRGLLAHGLVRAVAQLFFGEQTEDTAQLARMWIRRQRHLTGGEMFKVLTERVNPRIVVEKSPSNVSTLESLARTRRAFPQARYLHLVRHPLGQGRSLLKVSREFGIPSVALERWLARQGPQQWWYTCHKNIARFLDTLPADHKMRLRGEDLLEDPDSHLVMVAKWLGLRTDRATIEAMKHPERSPFARIGPPCAPWGNDPHFQLRPHLVPTRREVLSLNQPLQWNSTETGFPHELRELAREFGYS